jgi:hypothetical protein
VTKTEFFELRKTSIIKNFLKALANNLLEKLVLLLSVQYVIACHVITVTNYHLTWYSVVINEIFNTVKPLSIVSEDSEK